MYPWSGVIAPRARGRRRVRVTFASNSRSRISLRIKAEARRKNMQAARTVRAERRAFGGIGGDAVREP